MRESTHPPAGGRPTWRIAALAISVLALCVLVPLLVLSRSTAAHAATTTAAKAATTTGTAKTAHTAPLSTATANSSLIQPVATQTDPTSGLTATPVPAVAAAVAAVKANQALPSPLLPPLSELEGDNTYETPVDCQPTFGPGITPPKLCRFGDTHSKNVVVMIGDSHSGMYDPDIIADAKADHFTFITVAKSGCQLSVYDINHSGWPCGSWYKWAIAEDKKLHPVATVVSFLWKQGWEAYPADYVGKLKSILGQVTHGVLMEDFPYQNQQPATCVTTSGATMKTCSTPVPRTYTPFIRAAEKMAAAGHYPVMPTLQWFCGSGICPLVVNHTLVVHDKDHLTEDYSNDLVKVFSLELNPILAELEGTATTTTASTTTTTATKAS